MFDLEKVQALNELEILVYCYILEHLHQIPQQIIHQLATSYHVSISTTLRFYNKMGYADFPESKYVVKEEAKQTQMSGSFYDTTVHVDAFLRELNQEIYYEMLRPAVQMIVQARHTAFTGIGTDRILGSYGNRYSADLNIDSYNIADPFTPIPKREFENTLALILSVSGETNEMIKQMTNFKTAGAKVLSITNNQHSTTTRLTDYDIPYYMPDERSPFTGKSVNTTTQIPVIALTEPLAHQAGQLSKGLDEAPFQLFFTGAHAA